MVGKLPGMELLKLVIEIEKNGHKFFKLVATNKTEEMWDIFMQLASHERYKSSGKSGQVDYPVFEVDKQSHLL